MERWRVLTAAAIAGSLAGVAAGPASAAGRRSTDALLSRARVHIVGATKGDLAGASVANAGDVNGDGIQDLVLGAYLYGRKDDGAAYVIFGKRGSRTIDLRKLGRNGFLIRGVANAGYAGYSVAGGRDVNGDGLDDVVVGAPFTQRPGLDYRGTAYVVLGKRDTRPVSLGSLGPVGMRVDGQYVGRSVSLAKDMNGDGRAEVVLGDGHTTGFGVGPATAYVVYGTSAPVTVNADQLGGRGFEIDDRPQDAWSSVAGLGDVNGDGRGDVMVGMQIENFPPGPGAAYVVFGKGDGAAVDLTHLGSGGFAIRSTDAGGRAGAAVADAGDTNADGLDDVIVGAPWTNGPGGIQSGAAYVVYGNRTPGDVALGSSLGSAGFSIAGTHGGDGVLTGGEQLGSSVASAGDVNHDGRADVIVGAPYAGGSAYVVVSPGTSRPIRLAGSGVLAGVGRAVAAGNFGAGAPEAVLGAFTASSARRANDGAAYITSVRGAVPARSGAARVEPLGARRASWFFDGRRYVVFRELRPGVMRVYDVRTHRAFDQAIDPSCEPFAAAEGLVIVNCYGPFTAQRPSDLLNERAAHPYVYLIATRRLVPAAGDSTVDNEMSSWGAVGTQWIVGNVDCSHPPCTLYRNWHTGATFQGSIAYEPDQCFDLDSPTRREIPCPPFGLLSREGPYRLEQPNRSAYPAPKKRPLLLVRGRRRLRLSDCAGQGCATPELAAGRVTWAEGDVVHGYVIATHRRVTWSLPRLVASTAEPPTLVRLGAEVIATRSPTATIFRRFGQPDPPLGDYQVYRLRW